MKICCGKGVESFLAGVTMQWGFVLLMGAGVVVLHLCTVCVASQMHLVGHGVVQDV